MFADKNVTRIHGIPRFPDFQKNLQVFFRLSTLAFSGTSQLASRMHLQELQSYSQAGTPLLAEPEMEVTRGIGA
jgi:hypothetical protein